MKTKRFVYIPPNSDRINRFAHSLYRHLGERTNTTYTVQEINNFANFIRVVAKIRVKQLNSEKNDI
jgi:hypothetical protein